MSIKPINYTDYKRDIELIANTGVQFLDYEFSIDWEDDEDLNVQRFGKGYFKKSANGLYRLYPDLDLKEKVFRDPYNNDEEVTNLGSEDILRYTQSSPKPQESLKLYNGVWFPIPMFVEDRKDLSTQPKNWARCRVVQTSPLNESKITYRVVIAVDTTLQSNDQIECYGPTLADLGLASFAFDWKKGATDLLKSSQQDGRENWVLEWIDSIFSILMPSYKERYKKRERLQEAKDRDEHIYHYLNVVACIGGIVRPNNIKISRLVKSSNPDNKVSLVLDLGNSRSCGLLLENNGEESETFSDTKLLCIRDLNTPEVVYEGTFESRVEFNKANFDFENNSAKSRNPSAFTWPSLVRIGKEASNLASHRHGSNGNLGLTSPKRYLWKSQPEVNKWFFNPYSYQIPLLPTEDDPERSEIVMYNRKDLDLEYASQMPFCRYINSAGTALFALNKNDQSGFDTPQYSYKSTMTFMLVEILLQTICQINSFNYRISSQNFSNARRIDNIVLSIPPAMPDIERETLRRCAYEAIGIVWKTMGYDRENSPDNQFNFITQENELKVPAPKVTIEWDEALNGQIVYLYNECMKVYRGNCRDFIEDLTRKNVANRFGRKSQYAYEGKSELLSGRIASLDIGGGTTDLVITDYYFRKDRTNLKGDLEPNEILKEGFKIAGDDLLLSIINSEIIAPLKKKLVNEAKKKNQTLDIGVDSIILELFGAGGNNDSEANNLRVQAIQQLLMKVGYRILFLLEKFDDLPNYLKARRTFARGTIKDFIEGTFKCVDAKGTEITKFTSDGIETYSLPTEFDKIIEFINSRINRTLQDFNIATDLELNVNITALNRKIAQGKDISLLGSINKLVSLVSLYQCDVLLLTGRTSKIPGIRTFILNQVNLPESRVISMHKYNCGSWYPMPTKGNCIGDPKTTVVVGAILALKKRITNTMVNFHLKTRLPPTPSSIRFLGGVDDKNQMADDEIILEYYNKFFDVDQVVPEKSNIFDPGYSKEIEEILVMEKNRDTEKKLYTTLPKYIGYRQFDDPDYPATLLFRIENFTDVSQIKKIQELSNKKFDIEEYKKSNQDFEKYFFNLYGISEIASFKEMYKKNGDLLTKATHLANDLAANKHEIEIPKEETNEYKEIMQSLSSENDLKNECEKKLEEDKISMQKIVNTYSDDNIEKSVNEEIEKGILKTGLFNKKKVIQGRIENLKDEGKNQIAYCQNRINNCESNLSKIKQNIAQLETRLQDVKPQKEMKEIDEQLYKTLLNELRRTTARMSIPIMKQIKEDKDNMLKAFIHNMKDQDLQYYVNIENSDKLKIYDGGYPDSSLTVEFKNLNSKASFNHEIPEIQEFKIDSISSINRTVAKDGSKDEDVKEFCDLVFRTSQVEKYWIDSGNLNA